MRVLKSLARVRGPKPILFLPQDLQSLSCTLLLSSDSTNVRSKPEASIQGQMLPATAASDGSKCGTHVGIVVPGGMVILDIERKPGPSNVQANQQNERHYHDYRQICHCVSKVSARALGQHGRFGRWEGSVYLHGNRQHS